MSESLNEWLPTLSPLEDAEMRAKWDAWALLAETDGAPALAALFATLADSTDDAAVAAALVPAPDETLTALHRAVMDVGATERSRGRAGLAGVYLAVADRVVDEQARRVGPAPDLRGSLGW